MEWEGKPMTAREVAEVMGMSQNSIYRYFHEGRLRGFRLPGRAIRFPRKAVKEFLEQAFDRAWE